MAVAVATRTARVTLRVLYSRVAGGGLFLHLYNPSASRSLGTSLYTREATPIFNLPSAEIPSALAVPPLSEFDFAYGFAQDDAAGGVLAFPLTGEGVAGQATDEGARPFFTQS